MSMADETEALSPHVACAAAATAGFTSRAKTAKRARTKRIKDGLYHWGFKNPLSTTDGPEAANNLYARVQADPEGLLGRLSNEHDWRKTFRRTPLNALDVVPSNGLVRKDRPESDWRRGRHGP